MKSDIPNVVNKLKDSLIANTFYTDKNETILSTRDLPTPDV